MEAPRLGNGSDFNSNTPYRMYHGRKVPGFPKHPHRGFETITATIDGLIDHSDSLGCGGRYGIGDLQWMTAGSGVCHAEMFPLINQDKGNPTRFFQIWLNLPSRNKMVDPDFVMHWAEDVVKHESEDGTVSATIWAGNLFGREALAPTQHSWAADPANKVGIWFFEVQPGGSVVLEADDEVNRSAYFVEGSSLKVGDRELTAHSVIMLHSTMQNAFLNTGDDVAEFIVLQGKPINEPIAKYGPFVMNTQNEIKNAFRDYQRTEFGGWPYDRDDPVYPLSKGRFARLHGEETHPPSQQ